MEQKHFYLAFNLLFDSVSIGLGITQKEELYRMLFKDVYLMASDELFDNDPIRKVTSGGTTIHRKAVKFLCTEIGFEAFRINIETLCLPKIANKADFITNLIEYLNTDTSVPDNIKQVLVDGLYSESDYEFSRSVAGIMLCLDHSDYIYRKGTGAFFDVEFMRLYAEHPVPKYPKYISDSPNAAVTEYIGRKDELDELHKEIFEGNGKIVISAVGGLGKTELVKFFLNEILNTEITENGIEKIAWIPYDNNNLCLSLKQSLRLKCDLDDVWQTVQNMSAEYNKRLLLVIDNIESTSNDEYLKKLSTLQCRIIVTSRQKKIYGFNKIMYLKPLETEECRELFYLHYQFQERDNEILNDIIELTAKLTIMIVFIAKAAYLEGLSLSKLYRSLVEKGFKLSEEDVSCEHEKMQNDETIIKQMCILFSLVKYSEADKTILTYISVIPNLQFDFSKAKRWFKVKKNSSLMKLYNMGMLEHITNERQHIYWMHSVIAAAVREQQKEILYDITAPFIHELSEELEVGDCWGKGYTKLDLIPFSWSVSDLLENHWCNEDDSVFLLRLYYICFEASNYALCRTLIEKVLEIDKTLNNNEMLTRDYKTYSELLLRFDEVEAAIKMLDTAKEYMEQSDSEHKLKREWAFLWHQYGNIYFHSGKPNEALDYYTDALELDLSIPSIPQRELATDYISLASVFEMCGDLPMAYDMIQKAMETEEIDEEDSESIMLYYYMAAICTDFVADGYEQYADEAEECYKKVIMFREEHFSKHSNDLADVYIEYSNFLYQSGEYKKSKTYCAKAKSIYTYLYGEDSYHVIQCQSNEALTIAEEGDLKKAVEIYAEIIQKVENMRRIPVSDLCNDYQNYADLLEYSDRYEDSKEYFLKCINLIKSNFSDDSPRLAQPYLGIANCFMGLEDYEGAVSYLVKLFDLTDNDDLLLRITYHKLGTCYAFLDDYEPAIDCLKKALDLCDENGITDMGYIYVDLSTTYRYANMPNESMHYEGLARDFANKINDDELNCYVHTLDKFQDEK